MHTLLSFRNREILWMINDLPSPNTLCPRSLINQARDYKRNTISLVIKKKGILFGYIKSLPVSAKILYE
jgi:hypothetical protein